MCIPWAAMGYRTLFLKAYGFEDWEARAQRQGGCVQLQTNRAGCAQVTVLCSSAQAEKG